VAGPAQWAQEQPVLQTANPTPFLPGLVFVGLGPKEGPSPVVADFWRVQRPASAVQHSVT
jgi:hypothetical protein